MRVRRRLAVLSAIAISAVSANSGLAHSGSPAHYTGQQSTGTWRGITATIEVGNPDVVYDTSAGGFISQRIIAKLSDDSKWIEIGWAEVAWHQTGAPPVPQPEIYTYVLGDGGPGWLYHGTVTPGSTIGVRIESSCSATCTWSAKIWQGSSWLTLRTFSFGAVSQNIEAYNEVDPGNPCKKHVVLATVPDGKVQWYPVTVKNSSSAWQYWTSGVNKSATSGPYTSAWQINSYKFTEERTGAATC